MIDISVIMPVFNSEKYLSIAISSVLKQSFLNFELILINDGSTDNSINICEKFAKEDTRIVLINQTNAGISKTRNKGISIARGRYITFIDNDDEYSEDLLADNYNLLIKHDADLVKYGTTIYRIDADEKVVKKTQCLMEGINIIPTEKIADYYPSLRRSGLFENIWNGMYKKALLDKLKPIFDETVTCGTDDQLCNILLLPYINKLVTNPKCYYNWYQREGKSTSMKFNPEVFPELAQLCYVELTYIDQINDSKKLLMYRDYKLFSYYCHNFTLLSRDKRLSTNEKRKFFKEIKAYPVYKYNLNLEYFFRFLKKGKWGAVIIFLYFTDLDIVLIRYLMSAFSKR